jgi:hypothetical protein
MVWWDWGYWALARGRRAPISNGTQAGGPEAAGFYASTDPAQAAELLDKLGARYVIANGGLSVGQLRMPDYPGKFHAIVEWIGQDPADYTPLYDIPREGGGADKVLLYRPKYFQTMAMRLYLHDGRAYEPNASTTVFALRDAGGPRKLISSYRTFRTYQEAERYIAARPGQDLVLGSLNPLVSCVPLEPVPGLRLVFDSNPGEPIAVDRVPRTVKIFERVKLSTQFRKYGLAVDALPAPLRPRLWSWTAATAEPRP